MQRELALFSDLDSLRTGLAYHLQGDKSGLQLRPINVKGEKAGMRKGGEWCWSDAWVWVWVWVAGLPDKVQPFSQGRVAASRKQVQPCLADYFMGDV